MKADDVPVDAQRRRAGQRRAPTRDTPRPSAARVAQTVSRDALQQMENLVLPIHRRRRRRQWMMQLKRAAWPLRTSVGACACLASRCVRALFCGRSCLCPPALMISHTLPTHTLVISNSLCPALSFSLSPSLAHTTGRTTGHERVGIEEDARANRTGWLVSGPHRSHA